MDSIDIKDTSFAAIDLGSNSFHMLVAEPEGDSIRIIDSLRLPVRLGAGLDKKKQIVPETMESALDAMGQFAQRLQGVPRQNVRVVGTNTLRRARNSAEFIEKSFQLLHKRIEIIAGREEARLIYSAVSHGLPSPERARLVIDIGGGSTELIIGKGYSPALMESMNMGCVSYTNTYFPDDKITADNLKSSTVNAQLELQPIKNAYLESGWEEVIGCSGTIKAASNALHELGLTDGTITRSAMKELLKQMADAESMSEMGLQSISKNRSQVFTGGITILYALMKTLKVEELQASQVALREGLIFELIGKTEHTNIQRETIDNLASRYHVDLVQSERVETLALKLFELAEDKWELEREHGSKMLRWVAKIHEIGLSVAHSQYHKHGAYLIDNSDLLGFSKTEQAMLALLVRFHRRKLDLSAFSFLPDNERSQMLNLVVILRLAVLLQRSRYTEDLSMVSVIITRKSIKFQAGTSWFESHPLTAADLENEAKHLSPTGIELSVEVI